MTSQPIRGQLSSQPLQILAWWNPLTPISQLPAGSRTGSTHFSRTAFLSSSLPVRNRPPCSHPLLLITGWCFCHVPIRLTFQSWLTPLGIEPQFRIADLCHSPGISPTESLPTGCYVFLKILVKGWSEVKSTFSCRGPGFCPGTEPLQCHTITPVPGDLTPLF